MTMEQPGSEFFTAGGTLPPDAPSYVKRPTDDELFRHITNGEFCYILTPRQMGKSSLMIRTAQRLQIEGIRSAIVDLTVTGTVESEDQWYKGILTQIKRRLRINIDPMNWWEQKKDIPNIQKFVEFFEEVLTEVKEYIVIFIDEIDTTLKLDFRDDFFAGIRAIFNARAENPDLKRLTFVLLGVASPSDLIKDRNRTPFNIGQEISLKPFSRENARMLEIGIEKVCPGSGKKILDRIFYWTNGHPYLTQKICQSVVENHLSEYDDHKIDELVERLFISEEASRETNLQFVRDNILGYSERRVILSLYKKLLQSAEVRDNKNSLPQNHLKLTGLALADEGKLIVSNRIYRSVFDLRWATRNIPNNWPKIIAVGSFIFSLLLLSVFTYNLIVGGLSSQYAGNFYMNQSSNRKLENLARLFELHGFLTNTDYDFRARELFYSLNWRDQTKLFNDPHISSSDKQKFLIPVIEGLYVTMADVEGEQGNSDLLGMMRDSLKDVKTAESANLQNEINLWLEARSALNNQDALDKYDDVIKLNPNNPATHYERALVAIRLGHYEQALVDLDTTMGLAQNISSEASEKEIATPTQRPTKTPIRQTNTPVVATNHSITETPQMSTQTAVATANLTEVAKTQVPVATHISEVTSTPNSIPREGYRSSFYSIAYIRSAIDLVIQENNGKPDFDNALITNFSKLTTLRNAGLINFLELASFATQTAIAQSLQPTIFFSTSMPTRLVLQPKTSTPSSGPIDIAEGMVPVPAGTYEVGTNLFTDNYHIAPKKITLDSFWIDQYQVTNQQYQEYITGWSFPPGEDKHPARGVTWDQADAYCKWKNKRLPSEAEWEAAGRGSGENPQLYPWGPDFTKAQELPSDNTYEVGTQAFNVSPFKVYDMVGNVWEWVGELYESVPDGTVVLRGGRYSNPQDLAFRLHPVVSSRDIPYTGFRCAADQVQEKNVTATPTSAPNPSILYQDNFTDPTSGWPEEKFDNYFVGYHESGNYHIEIDSPNYKVTVLEPGKQNLGDVTIEMKVSPTSHLTAVSGDFRYGLVFRSLGDHYYAFAISPRSKKWYVLKISRDQIETLNEGVDNSIHDGDVDDALRVDAQGSTFFFHINDQLVGQVTDPDYTTGAVGLYSQTFDNNQTHIAFDYLLIRKFEAPQPALTISPAFSSTPTTAPKPIACNHPSATKNLFPQLKDVNGQFPMYGPEGDSNILCQAVYDIVHTPGTMAVHFKYENIGTNFGWWGIATPNGYDASQYKQICFWAYAQKPNQSFRFKMKDTTLKENGIVRTLDKTNEWQQICADLGEFSALGIQVNKMNNINLGFEQPTGSSEIWIADFEFK